MLLLHLLLDVGRDGLRGLKEALEVLVLLLLELLLHLAPGRVVTRLFVLVVVMMMMTGRGRGV